MPRQFREATIEIRYITSVDDSAMPTEFYHGDDAVADVLLYIARRFVGEVDVAGCRVTLESPSASVRVRDTETSQMIEKTLVVP